MMVFEYFTAKWCQPCKIYGPIVEKASAELEINLEKIDIDKNPERLPNDVMGVPTIIKMVDGKEVARLVGQRSEQEFKDWVLG